MTKPRVVMVHPPTKLYPFEFWPPAFDGLDVETVAVECRTRAEALEAVRGADVVMIGFFKVDAEMVAAMDRAQAICGFGHGYDTVDVDAATRAGILVTNAARMCHLEVANHAAAMILALNRKLVQYDRAMRQGVWDRPGGPADHAARRRDGRAGGSRRDRPGARAASPAVRPPHRRLRSLRRGARAARARGAARRAISTLSSASRTGYPSRSP